MLAPIDLSFCFMKRNVFCSPCFISFFNLIAIPSNSTKRKEFHLPVATAMSSFIPAILEPTVVFLLNAGRKIAAKILKEGDVTYEQLHKFIMSKLDDIKSNLKGIARNDLLASIDFFEEGLVYLYEVTPEKEAAPPLKQDAGSSEANVKTVSLAEKMKSFQLTDLDNSSARALNDAKDRFKQAREKATQAFCNEGLRTSDRILAMQYRILATILEKVDCLADALAACRLCLKALHSMPAVKERLNVHLQQGFESMLNKAKREDTIRSVCRMNRVIFYISQIVEEDTDISLWPCVDLGEYKVDPLRDVRVTKTIEKEDPQYFLLKTWPLFQEGEETIKFVDWLITINSKGQLMIAATDDNVKCVLLKLFDRNGNLLQSLQLTLPLTDSNAKYYNYFRRVIDIATDRASNVFLLTYWDDLSGFFRNTVLVLDQHANFQHEFDTCGYSIGSCFAVSDDSKVFVSTKVGKKFERGCVLVYNFNGVLLNSIENASLGPVMAMTSIDSEGGRVVVLGRDLDSSASPYVYQFSELGNFLSRYCVSSNRGTGQIRFLHKTEHVVEPNFSKENLLLYNKDGMVVREIKLKPSALYVFDAYEQKFTVTTQGLVAMLATDKRTGKKMIVIL